MMTMATARKMTPWRLIAHRNDTERDELQLLLKLEEAGGAFLSFLSPARMLEGGKEGGGGGGGSRTLGESRGRALLCSGYFAC